MTQLLYIFYCVIVYIEYFPRLIKLIKTKSSSDYSLGSQVLSLIGMFSWVAYIFLTDQELILYIGAAVDIILNVLFVALVFKYYKGTKKGIPYEDKNNK